MLTILTKKDLIDERKLRIADPATLKKTFAECAQERADNRLGRRGWSKNKENMAVARWDRQIYWQVARVVDKILDPVERDKVRERILRTQFSKFQTRDTF